MMKELILLRGLPGSGKSTLAKSLLNSLIGHVEADMFFMNEGQYMFDATKLKQAHQWCQDKTESYMGPHGLDKIVVSNTFTQEWEMKPYFDLAKKYGYIVFSLIIENRHEGKNEHGVPEEKLKQMRDRFEISL
jgi:predicted kinase